MSTNELWVLNSDSPHAVDDDGRQEQGFAYCGVFSSPLRAIDHLREHALGPELVDRFKWYRAPDIDGYINDGYILGYLYQTEEDREYFYHIIRCEVDEEWPGTRPEANPGFVALEELPKMFDNEDALYADDAASPAGGNVTSKGETE